MAAPLTLFVGGADDWTAPQPCIDLAGRSTAAGEPVTITVYPGIYHGFDGPAAQSRLRLEVPNGVHPGQGVTVAPNPAARDDAYARLKVFLRDWLPRPPGPGRDSAWPPRSPIDRGSLGQRAICYDARFAASVDRGAPSALPAEIMLATVRPRPAT